MASNSQAQGMAPMEVLEEALVIFRRRFVADAWVYYLGAIPFAAAVVWTWSQLTGVTVPSEEVAAFALLVTAAYLLKTTTDARYMVRLLLGTEDSASRSAFAAAAATPQYGSPITAPAGANRANLWLRFDTVLMEIGCRGLLVLVWLLTSPLLAGIIPLYIAAQYASIMLVEKRASRPARLKTILRRAIASGFSWYGGQLLAALVGLFLFAIMVIDLVIAAQVLPWLLQTLLGWETTLSRAALFMADSTLFAVMSAFAYLLLDPVVKAVCAVTYFRLQSRHTGADLELEIQRLRADTQLEPEIETLAVNAASAARRDQLVSALVLPLVLSIFLGGRSVSAQSLPTQPPATQAGDAVQASIGPLPTPEQVEHYRRALDAEASRPVYRWHPVYQEKPTPGWLRNTAFGRALLALGHWVSRIWHTFVRWLKWLWHKLFGRRIQQVTKTTSPSYSVSAVGWILIIVSALAAAVLVLIYLRRRRPQEENAAAAVTVLPSGAELENALPTDRSEEEWLRLCRELEASGQIRFALRAAFLACLSALGARRLLSIRRDRTNREYLLEFRRRLQVLAPADASDTSAETRSNALGEMIRTFNRVWYGGAEIDTNVLRDFLDMQRQVVA